MKLDLSALNVIEKWIVEHGSATVMGVHIQLLRDQLSALDREATHLKAKVAELEATNKDLAEKCQHRVARIHELEVTAQKQAGERRSEVEEKLMLLLTEGRTKTARELAREIDAGLDTTEVRLNSLKDADFVLVSMFSRMEFEAPRPNE